MVTRKRKRPRDAHSGVNQEGARQRQTDKAGIAPESGLGGAKVHLFNAEAQ